ncbi:hypothetical protein [Mesorhizobium sp. Cs1321R2N1]|uniref:hypothetical protein n=1 Tax=Mesorhizobium sp. Cs1321R2N1 TaxID=3015174 RepID=UPI00301D9347
MTRKCPEYRLRLFLSVDLVGSTAFKARKSDPNSSAEAASPNPAWVDEIRRFYHGFPNEVSRAYDNIEKPTDWTNISAPKVWKTVGDEIIFCCRLDNFDHLAISIRAFITALGRYGEYLESRDKPTLDVKGCGWVAAFPYPNVTVKVFNPADGETPQSLPVEDVEAAADAEPTAYDFLGKEIDSGFRMGKHCSANSFAMSIQMAWLLAKYGDAKPLDGIRFSYAGRQVLKGVIGDRPYPLLSIDVERSATRRKVRHFERAIGGTENFSTRSTYSVSQTRLSPTRGLSRFTFG